MGFAACATLPEPEYKEYAMPDGGLYVGKEDPGMPYDKLGIVRVKYDFNSLDAQRDTEVLCRNAYNRAARDLLARAKKEKKADAVVQVQSVVFYLDGSHELYDTPECSDEGGEGQILLQGQAVKFLNELEVQGRRARGAREVRAPFKLTTLPEPGQEKRRKRVRADDPEAVMRFVPEKQAPQLKKKSAASAEEIERPEPEPSPTARPVPQDSAPAKRMTNPLNPASPVR